MPNINDINGVTVANLAKLDAVLKANISKVNGLTLAAAFTGLLDTYTGAAAAYSTRKLKSGVTVAMRIRRDNDDVEADLEFDSNNTISLSSPISNASSGTFTDLADFADHTGSQHDIHVASWKDQSGNSKDAASAFTAQPYIYTGGTLQTVNSEPAVRVGYTTAGAGTNTRAEITGGVDYQTNSETFFTIVRYDDSAEGSAPAGAFWGPSNPTGNDVLWFNLDATNFSYWANGNRGSNAMLTTTTTQPSILNTQFLFTGECDGSTMSIYIDGTLSDSKTATFSLTNGNFDDVFGNAQFFSEGYIQEFIIWPDDRSANRTGIEGNVNAHFQIGNFGTPTSGLLATYTGAAAAYSVRQLANTAALAMRIREDGTDTETDIGFDSNGDLDTAAIASHCGSNNGYVVTWYDQAGSQNDATQGTSGSQPQIYNGTAVITENGKPTLDFDGSNDFMTSAAITSTGDQTFAFVTKIDTTSGTGVLASSDQRALFNSGGTATYQSSQATENDKNYGSYTTSQMLHFVYHDNTTTSDSFGRINTTEDALDPSANGKWDDVILGRYDATSSLNYNGNIQEFIFWTGDQSGNVTGIETDINTYFSIY